jgi:hypothetical protein
MNSNMAVAGLSGLVNSGTRLGLLPSGLDLRVAVVPAIRAKLRGLRRTFDCSLDLAFGRFAFVAIHSKLRRLEVVSKRFRQLQSFGCVFVSFAVDQSPTAQEASTRKRLLIAHSINHHLS